MAILRFPPVTTAHTDGLLAIGGDLDVESLVLAYSSGIFPWPHPGLPLLWFAPPKRAILDFSEWRVSKRTERYLKQTQWTLSIDRHFETVIRHCATVKRRGQRGTWITPDMINAYLAFHRAGYAHSFETIDEHGTVVGGLYGVRIGNLFAAESMFHLESNASKFALIKTVEYLQQSGLGWMDVQVMTPLLKQFGAKEIPRAEFMKKI